MENILENRGIFLDRDGTLTRDEGYTHLVADLEILPGVVEGLKQLQQAGFLLFITTNQAGVARGYFTLQDMHRFNDALLFALKEAGVTIAQTYYCPYHPTEGVGEWRLDSPDRKPNPGMILRAQAEFQLDLQRSFTIGDRRTDMGAGLAAGCGAVLLDATVTAGNGDGPPPQRPYSCETVAGNYWVAADFLHAVKIILER